MENKEDAQAASRVKLPPAKPNSLARIDAGADSIPAPQACSREGIAGFGAKKRSRVSRDAPGVGRAMAASTTPVRARSALERRALAIRSMPAARAKWCTGSRAWKKSLSRPCPAISAPQKSKSEELNTDWEISPANLLRALSGNGVPARLSTMMSADTPHRSGGTWITLDSFAMTLAMNCPMSRAPGKIPDMPTTAISARFKVMEPI